ncbi:MAG: SGNH/GDSL hydrolase family protein, partial [Bradymonadia bacterium]
QRLMIIILLAGSITLGCEHSNLDLVVTEECLETGECSPDDLDNASPQDVTQADVDDSQRPHDGETNRESQAFDDGVTAEQVDENEEETFLTGEDDVDVAEDDQRDIDEQENDFDAPTEPSTQRLRIQAIGDSHLAFNGELSTADQIRDVLNERGADVVVQNNAVGGATLGCGEDGIGSQDNCIPPQLEDGGWTHVVLSGGGNDFLESQCGVDVNALMTPALDGGLMVDLIDEIRAMGALVTIVGYVSPLDPQGEAGSCQPIKTLLDRYRDFASSTTGVSFIDTREVFGPNQPSMYADDIHTSVEGSRRLAEAIAENLLNVR